MNDFDNEIKKIIKKEVNKPLQYEYAIKNTFLKRKNEISHTVLYKIAAIAGCLVMGCTGVMATSYIYEKIWKNPVAISQKDEEQKIKEDISNEEKIGFISEETAVEIANQILAKLGYESKEFTQVSLIRGYDSKYSKHYLLKSGDILINLNPENGELEYLGDTSIINQNIICDDISEEKINKIATNIYNELDIFNDSDNYGIIESKRQKIVSGNNINDLWQVSFSKIYNGTYEKTNISTIAFAVVNDEIVIYTITGKNDNNFENNPIIITEEEAIEIAKNKEKEFSELEISNISTELSIEKMNIFIYCLENNLTNENGELRVNDISRNVWVVNIEHTKDIKPKDGMIETVKKLYNKKYYIDATTGEIIGGKQSEFFQ